MSSSSMTSVETETDVLQMTNQSDTDRRTSRQTTSTLQPPENTLWSSDLDNDCRSLQQRWGY